MAFRDSYRLVWTLRDEDGNPYTEIHRGLSMSDFETVYGNEPNEILKLDLEIEDNM